VIVDCQTGFLFEKGSVDELAAKTLLAAGDPTLRARIGTNASKTVQRHSIEHAVDAYLSVAHELVASRMSSRSLLS
jgi:glycosyltransferase involved in cell wall biosynthesis